MVVSIVTVCYQAEATMAEAMQSVLAQIPALPKGWRLEYLVVDGASSAFEDWGSYNLSVSLSESASACPCP